MLKFDPHLSHVLQISNNSVHVTPEVLQTRDLLNAERGSTLLKIHYDYEFLEKWPFRNGEPENDMITMG